MFLLNYLIDCLLQQNIKWEVPGNCVVDGIPKRTGQPSSVPRICSIPSIWEMSRPTVTASWFTVPRPPRNVSGAISEMYIGTSEVFRPAHNNSSYIITKNSRKKTTGVYSRLLFFLWNKIKINKQLIPYFLHLCWCPAFHLIINTTKFGNNENL